jgi:hypothetical protein
MNTKQLFGELLFVLFIIEACVPRIIAQAAQDQVYTHSVAIWGNNFHWTKIATVHPHTLIRVYADGSVKFGFCSTTDTAVAGVEGNRLYSWLQRTFGADSRTKRVHPSSNSNTAAEPKPVNFDQGGVWIKIVDRATGQTITAPELYHYWDRVLNSVGFSSDKMVDVYAKAHDGGQDPESVRDYQDNSGYYRVWLGLIKLPQRASPD